MGFNSIKSLSLATLLLLMLSNTINLSRASSSSCVNGSIHDCLIAETDDNFEFLMDSHSSRLLLNPGDAVTGNTGNSNKPAVGCGQNNPYASCLPDPNKPKVPENCGIYNRGRAC